MRKAILTLLLACSTVVLASPRAEATQCDLYNNGTTNLSTCDGLLGTIGLFHTDEQHPTGTGVVDSFLRVQQNGWEQGYNTSTRPVQDNVQVKIDPNFTRDLQVSELSVKTFKVNGQDVDYYEFFLDVNEQAALGGAKNLITLDQLEIFGSNTAGLDYYYASSVNSTDGGCLGTEAKSSSNPQCKNAATQVYDLDTVTGAPSGNTQDNWVNIDYLVKGNGSGSSDMVFYLQKSLLQNYTYVYLFSQFGVLSGTTGTKFASGAGFEEWFVKDFSSGNNTGPVTPVPEPASLLLVGSGLGFVARRWRQARKA